MRRIDLNLAAGRRIDPRRFLTLLLLLLLAALGLSWSAGRALARHAHRRDAVFRAEAAQKSRSAELARMQKELERLVGQKRPAWQPRIDFCNRLVVRKAFSFRERLDFLERILPAPTQCESLSLENGSARIGCQLVSPSFAKLRETYRLLSRHGMSVSGEFEKDGLWHVTLTVQYGDEKK